MPVRISIPNYSSSRTSVVLGDEDFILHFRYLKVDGCWKMDIYNRDDEAIITGLGIKPNLNLTGKYLLNDIIGGTLWCVKTTNTKETLTRDNINIDYQLWFYRNDEAVPL